MAHSVGLWLRKGYWGQEDSPKPTTKTFQKSEEMMGHVTKPTPAKCSQGALSPKDCKAVASHVLKEKQPGSIQEIWVDLPVQLCSKISQTHTWKGGLGLLSKNASAMIKPNITFWICLGCGNAGNGPTSDDMSLLAVGMLSQASPVSCSGTTSKNLQD